MSRWPEITRATNAQIVAWAEAQPRARAMTACQQELILPADTSSGPLCNNVISADNPPPASPPAPAPAGEGRCGAGALEMDIVSDDVKKFLGLFLKKNGCVLEQLYSPLIVHTTPEHAELKAICRSGRESAHSSSSGTSSGTQSRLTSAATGVITKHHSHQYFGFAETQCGSSSTRNGRGA